MLKFIWICKFEALNSTFWWNWTELAEFLSLLLHLWLCGGGWRGRNDPKNQKNQKNQKNPKNPGQKKRNLLRRIEKWRLFNCPILPEANRFLVTIGHYGHFWSSPAPSKINWWPKIDNMQLICKWGKLNGQNWTFWSPAPWFLINFDQNDQKLAVDMQMRDIGWSKLDPPPPAAFNESKID